MLVSVNKRLVELSPFLISLIVLLYLLIPFLINPIFGGDAGSRLNFAHSFIVPPDNRIWLPLLQAHLWLLYQVKVPIIVYQLIPVVYFVSFLFIINLISNKLLGTKLLSLLITTLLLVSIENHILYFVYGTQLFQEFLIFFFFSLLFYMFISGRVGPLFYLISSVALLSRENFWIYYFLYLIFGLFFYKNKIKNNSVYILLSMIPIVIWVVSTGQVFGLKVDVTDKALVTEVVFSRISRLMKMMIEYSLFIPLISVLFSYLIIRFSNIKATQNFLKGFFSFAALSIIFMFGYTIIADPWQATPYNPRALAPVLVVYPFMVLTVLKNALVLDKIPKYIICTITFFSLFSILLNGLKYTEPFNPERFKKQSYFEDIRSAVREYSNSTGRKAEEVGIVEIGYWEYYIPYIVSPLLYENRKFYPRGETAVSNILIAPEYYPNSNYLVFKKFFIEENKIYGNEKNSFKIMFKKKLN